MRPETELRTPPRARPHPEFDVEEEVDLGRYGRTLAARWWLPLAGLILGVLLGYLLAKGSGQVYQAEAVVSLGQPFSPGGDAPVQGLPTNPTTVDTIVHSESALKAAAAASGLRLAKLRASVSSKPISPGRGTARTGQTPLYEISVKGDGPRKAETAANALAQRVVTRVSGYVDDKIDALEDRLRSQNDAVASIDRRIRLQTAAVNTARGLSPLEQLVLISQLDNAEQRRAELIDERSATEQQLSLAEEVEHAQIVERGAAVKTTARSVRNSALVGGLIGLILGALAALVWEPAAARFARTRSV